MRNMRKILASGMAAVTVMSMAACGSESGVDKTYTVSYDNTLDIEVIKEIPDCTFVANNAMKSMIVYGVELDITLDLDKDGTYTLTAHYFNQAPDAVEGNPGYMDVQTVAEGTYTMDGNQVTISDATKATTSYNGGEYVLMQDLYAAFSFAENASSTDTGEWSSDEVPEVLECVPATVFTVDDAGNIVTWQTVVENAGNPHAE